jgi:hypothetical protein
MERLWQLNLDSLVDVRLWGKTLIQIIPEKFMSSAAITTIVKMVESLPADLQEKVVAHIRDYIADLEDEERWDNSFRQTQDNLVAAARKARQDIAAGQSMPLDYDQS